MSLSVGASDGSAADHDGAGPTVVADGQVLPIRHEGVVLSSEHCSNLGKIYSIHSYTGSRNLGIKLLLNTVQVGPSGFYTGNCNWTIVYYMYHIQGSAKE